ncbi:MAG: hypothetical protein SV062_06245 [Thermodesulfobacteriota bacterium]|nr:hypothetical protein [Thermodesulfobacteriota bacterium]
MTKGKLRLLSCILFIIGLVFYILVLPKYYAKVPLNEIGLGQYVMSFITLFLLCMGFGIFMITIHENWEEKKEEKPVPEQAKEERKGKDTGTKKDIKEYRKSKKRKKKNIK